MNNMRLIFLTALVLYSVSAYSLRIPGNFSESFEPREPGAERNFDKEWNETNSKTVELKAVDNTPEPKVPKVSNKPDTVSPAKAPNTSTSSDAAESNKDKLKAERARLDKVDPPIKQDPVGNALIGGGAAGIVKGTAKGIAAGVTAGAVSAGRGAVTGSTVDKAKDSIQENKANNDKSGRGGKDDPRYNPKTLLNK